ncbi:hypothetical protein AMS68_003820 [Peltaster fructicola]|uniref:alpha-glucosidase n=1 Tax=Peltaster fructicola TaxID=286661 RepID=A0A6H0XU99_9PEZI|nr:hypothetical protein AMS68_003820 [Peltaster fructicola]
MAVLSFKRAAVALLGLTVANAQSTAQQNGSPYTATNTVSANGPRFTIPAAADEGANVLPNIYNTSAVQAQSVCPGYTASNVQQNQYGFTAALALAGKPCNIYGEDVNDLVLSVAVQDDHRLNVKIQPAYLGSQNTSWFILPDNIVKLPQQGNPTGKIDLAFNWTNEPSFAFTVTRKSNGDVLFDTRGSVLVYENQFIEFVSKLPENYNLYGLGENIHNLRLGNNYTITMYGADAGNPIDRNIYGTHPIAIDTRYYEVNGKQQTLVTTQNTSASGRYLARSHGFYNRNAHAHEILLREQSITWRTLGGSVDLYFMDGPTAQDVISQYQSGVIELPALQQYWTFGFHQCRWGYKNWSQVSDVVDNYRKFNIPLETVWNDIDYMLQYRDFTNDPNTFPYSEGQALLSKLHAAGQHYVPIVDSAIYIPDPNNATDAYSVYTDGHSQDVFIKNPDGSEYIGAVWPGYTVFPDWHSQNAVSWWSDNLVAHHNNIPWDGIWIDMSEVSSFCVGSCGTFNLSLNPVHPPFQLPGEPGNIDYNYPENFKLTNSTEAASIAAQSASQSASVASAAGPAPTTTQPYFTPQVTLGARNVNQPPYIINNINGDLAVHAMSPNGTHADGTLDYDVHNTFGHQILHATYEGLQKLFPGKRPFIIGRSTFAGSGIWAGHWGGDNISLFKDMYFSISQALGFSIFGIPMFGVDTCGFSSNTDEELCNRWMQLSAFFPFYRNHNVLAAISQEAYVWESVADAAKVAMKIRYSLLPYMYTLFYNAHTTGSTVMRALAWEFSNDPTLAAVDNQFLLGPGLMVIPILGQGLTSRGGVFPGVAHGEVWYDWYTQTAVDAKAGENKTIQAPLGHIPVYVRGGTILPQQEALYTTAECRNSSWSLIVALDNRGSAKGQIYLDDGVSVSPPSSKVVSLQAGFGGIRATSTGSYVDTNKLANVTILGVPFEPKDVQLNGKQVSSGVAYNSTSKVLSVKGLESLTSSGAWAQDWTLTFGAGQSGNPWNGGYGDGGPWNGGAWRGQGGW